MLCRGRCHGDVDTIAACIQLQCGSPSIALVTLGYRPCVVRWVVRSDAYQLWNVPVVLHVGSWRRRHRQNGIWPGWTGHWMQLRQPSAPAQKDAAEVRCPWALRPDQWCSIQHCGVATLLPLKAGGIRLHSGFWSVVTWRETGKLFMGSGPAVHKVDELEEATKLCRIIANWFTDSAVMLAVGNRSQCYENNIFVDILMIT